MAAVIWRRFISFAHSRHPVTFPFVTQSRESPGPMDPVSRAAVLREPLRDARTFTLAQTTSYPIPPVRRWEASGEKYKLTG